MSYHLYNSPPVFGPQVKSRCFLRNQCLTVFCKKPGKIADFDPHHYCIPLSLKSKQLGQCERGDNFCVRTVTREAQKSKTRLCSSHNCSAVAMLCCSVVSDSVAPWAEGHYTPLSMEFSRKGFRSRLPFPTPGDPVDPEIKPTSLCLLHQQADSLQLAPPVKSQSHNITNMQLLYN